MRGYRSEGSVSIGFLKDRLLDKNSEVSLIVDKLFVKGFVARNENQVDRRQKDVEISSTGLAFIEKMIDCENKTDTLLHNLTLDEVQELNRLLDKIRG